MRLAPPHGGAGWRCGNIIKLLQLYMVKYEARLRGWGCDASGALLSF